MKEPKEPMVHYNLKLDRALAAALDAIARAMPNLSRSAIAREALRRGLDLIARDPRVALGLGRPPAPPAPSIEPSTEPPECAPGDRAPRRR
jgi:hypothetical protein